MLGGYSVHEANKHEISLGIFNYEIMYHCTSVSPEYVVIPSETIFFGVTQPEKAEYSSLGVIRQ